MSHLHLPVPGTSKFTHQFTNQPVSGGLFPYTHIRTPLGPTVVRQTPPLRKIMQLVPMRQSMSTLMNELLLLKSFVALSGLLCAHALLRNYSLIP